MKPTSVCLVHNGQIVNAPDGIGIERGLAQFIGELQAKFAVVGLSGFVSNSSTPLSQLGFESISSASAEGPIISPLARIVATNIPETRIQRVWRYITGMFGAARILRQYDFLYVVQPGYIGILTALLCMLVRRQFGVFVAGDWQAYPNMYRNTFGLVVGHADFVIAASALHASILKAYNSKVDHLAPMTAYELDTAVSKSDQIIHGPPKLLFVGRLMKAKGVFDLVEALRELHYISIKASLKFVGTGNPSEIQLLQEMICRFQLTEYVEFLGFVSDTDQLLNSYLQANIFVFPSHSEGFPRVLFEAMAAGLPIVATELPSYSGTMIPESNYIAVELASPRSLAAAIARLTNDSALRSQVALGGRETVRTVSPNSAVKTHAEQFYQLLMNNADSSHRSQLQSKPR